MLRAEAGPRASHEREGAGVDPGLELVRLSLGDPARLQVGVDLVDRRRLRCVFELLLRDAEVARDTAQEAAPRGRGALRGRVCAADTNDESENRRRREYALGAEGLH